MRSLLLAVVGLAVGLALGLFVSQTPDLPDRLGLGRLVDRDCDDAGGPGMGGSGECTRSRFVRAAGGTDAPARSIPPGPGSPPTLAAAPDGRPAAMASAPMASRPAPAAGAVTPPAPALRHDDDPSAFDPVVTGSVSETAAQAPAPETAPAARGAAIPRPGDPITPARPEPAERAIREAAPPTAPSRLRYAENLPRENAAPPMPEEPAAPQPPQAIAAPRPAQATAAPRTPRGAERPADAAPPFRMSAADVPKLPEAASPAAPSQAARTPAPPATASRSPAPPAPPATAGLPSGTPAPAANPAPAVHPAPAGNPAPAANPVPAARPVAGAAPPRAQGQPVPNRSPAGPTPAAPARMASAPREPVSTGSLPREPSGIAPARGAAVSSPGGVAPVPGGAAFTPGGVTPAPGGAPPGSEEAATLPPARSYTCRRDESAPGQGGPTGLRVRVQPNERTILVEAEEPGRDGDGPIRYTLDQAFMAWFGGRQEQDPRLSLVMSRIQGSLWLDVAAEGQNSRRPAGPQRFQCRPEGAATAQAP